MTASTVAITGDGVRVIVAAASASAVIEAARAIAINAAKIMVTMSHK